MQKCDGRATVKERIMFPTEYQEPTYNTAIQVVQMLRLLEDCPKGRMEVSKLAEELNVHPRTIKRYIEAIGGVITGARNKPYVERVRVGRTPYAQVNRPDTQTMSITLMEYAALRLATSSMNSLAPESFGYLHETVSEKAEAAVGRENMDRLKDFDRSFVYVPYGPKRYDEEADRVVRWAIEAVTNNHPATIKYESSNGKVQAREIHPLSIVLYRDALYIYARQRKPVATPNEFRYFAVDRIQSFAMDQSKTFKKPANYDAEQLGKNSLGIWNSGKKDRVKLRFTDAGARHVRERSWPNQRDFQEISANEVILEMEIPITPEVITWLAGWGRQVEVLEPEDLIDKLRNHLADALDFYV